MAPLTPAQRHFRWRIFALTWMAYAAFYFCRKNFSVVMPLLKSELGFTVNDLAWLIFGYNLFYMLGQFGCGVLSDRWGPRLVVGLGMIVAVVANVWMGFASTFILFLLLNSANGIGQSTGWSGAIRNMATWFRPVERGVVMAWWTTCYVLGGYLATLFAARVVTDAQFFSQWGWRRGFWAPAAVLLLAAAAYIAWTRNDPQSAGLPEINEDEVDAVTGEKVLGPSSFALLRHVLTNSAVWITGLMYFFLKLTRYSFLFWLPFYMTEQLHYSVRVAGETSAYYELAGFGGTLAAGYISDRLFQARRFPVGALMLFGLALACLIHPTLAATGMFWNVVGISLIGFFTFGPDTLMTGAAAMDFGTERGAATAAGVINGMGSCGQLLSSLIVAYFSHRWGWNSIFYLFVGCALIGALLLCLRWNYGGTKAVKATA